MKEISRINDYFIRYLFADKGNESILLDFINSVMRDSGFGIFHSVEILSPFNYKKNYIEKESVVDVKAVTKNGTVIMIEIQVVGNAKFKERTLYYWAKNYSSLIKKGESYTKLNPIISINLVDFILDKKEKELHTCYMIYESKNKKLLTDHLQIHYIELKKYKNNILSKDLDFWIKFFISKDLEVDMSEIVREKPLMEEVKKRYDKFVVNKDLMTEYEKREAYLYGAQIMLEEERRQGIEEGIEKGIEKGRITTAKKMLEMKMSVKDIMEITGFSKDEIEKLL